MDELVSVLRSIDISLTIIWVMLFCLLVFKNMRGGK